MTRATSLFKAALGWIAAAATAALLASCGGGDSGGTASVTPQQLRLQDAVADSASCSSGDAGYTLVDGQCLRSSTVLSSKLAQVRQLATGVAFTASTLMDWAQGAFPTLFPGSQADQAGNGFTYRFYPQTQTFLAVAGDAVYVLGPVTGNQLLYVGSVSGFSCSVNAAGCTVNNVAPLVVDSGPSGSDVNVLYTTVTICVPGSTTLCQTIDHIIVDTGSSGLRVLAGVLAPALSSLPLTPASGTQSLANCAQFVDGSFLWGPVVAADVSLGGEKASSVPVQIVGDSRLGSAPRACSGGSSATNTPESFGANGIIGISVFKEDCGPGCVSTTGNGFYYACAGSSCVNSRAALNQQLKNPVALFPQDNNGTLIILPNPSQSGAVSIGGSLVFGIGTQANNQMGTETVLSLDASGDFTTVLAGKTMPNSFIDSGSNGIFFDPSGPTVCSNSSRAPGFYCPASRLTLQATNIGANGVNSSSVTFSIDNADTLVRNSQFAVFPTLGGPMGDSTAMDWGLPFFFGRRVATAIESQSTPKGLGPWVAY